MSPRIGYFYGSNWEPKLVKEIQGQKLLSFAWKELGKSRTHIIANKPEKEMLTQILSVLNNCDIAIGHNIDKFDKRMMNAFFVKYGFSPPKPHQTIDTLKIARKHFSLPSNKLNDLALYLGLKPKLDTGFDVWEGCMNGDKKSWKKMIAYNKHDVVLTEQVYLKLRAWADNVPSISEKPNTCPHCGSANLVKDGVRYNKPRTIVRQEFKCKDCRGYCSTKKGTASEINIVN